MKRAIYFRKQKFRRSFAGAWIEMKRAIYFRKQKFRRSFAGAWIEMLYFSVSEEFNLSLLRRSVD